MANDIAEASRGDPLPPLRENTVFPESLSRRLTLDEGYAVQFELLERRKARGDVHCRLEGRPDLPGPCSFSRESMSPVWVTSSKPGTSPRRPCSASTS